MFCILFRASTVRDDSRLMHNNTDCLGSLPHSPLLISPTLYYTLNTVSDLFYNLVHKLWHWERRLHHLKRTSPENSELFLVVGDKSLNPYWILNACHHNWWNAFLFLWIILTCSGWRICAIRMKYSNYCNRIFIRIWNLLEFLWDFTIYLNPSS